ncbi:methyltransferase domain-containing protein [Micromonospora sp. NPDC049559]|uniref:methyltransferase domain-containing protein n=1 Tax=Micromonospora sp. NPDC049559 TaxID=3155923 RepID=UPI003425C590
MTVFTPAETPHPDLPSYSFDNDDPEAVDRHNYLSAMLDPTTFERLAGLGDLTGYRCLELGAGGGSVARWLAERVGPTGRVVATDLNTRHIPPHPGYTVLTHDLERDPLPEGPWDLIHARLVLLHVPRREEVLRGLADSLAPGGALVIEDWLTSVNKLVLAAPDAESAALFDAFQTTMVERILPAQGNDPGWAARVHGAMLDAGLVDVDTVISARSWPGGSPGTLIAGANIAQLRDQLFAHGFTPEQLDALHRLVADPRLVLRSNLTYSTVGRRAKDGR